MTTQLRLTFAGLIATAAILSQAPQASASLAAAAINGRAMAAAPSSSHPLPCELASQGTVISDATASLAQLGSRPPLAQASVLIAGLGCLAGGSLWIKRQLP